MAVIDPSDKSIKGLIAFARALSAETTSVIAAGFQQSFRGPSGATIVIGHTMPNTNYQVHVTPVEPPGDSGQFATNPLRYLGNFYVGNKTTTTFTVYNTGSADTGAIPLRFDWAVLA